MTSVLFAVRTVGDLQRRDFMTQIMITAHEPIIIKRKIFLFEEGKHIYLCVFIHEAEYYIMRYEEEESWMKVGE